MMIRVSSLTCAAAAVLAIGSYSSADLINVANPNNVLQTSSVSGASPPAGETVYASDSGLSGGPFGPAPTMVDNEAADHTQDSGFLFTNAPSVANPNSAAFTGFSAPNGFSDVRFFLAPQDAQRVPASISVYASTTAFASQASALNTANYTLLGTFLASSFTYTSYDPGETPSQHRDYADLPVSAPAGTTSLLLVVPQDQPGNAGTRFYEVQALVPEPASAGVIAIGVLGLLARRRRA
jgi:hypothetical protein